MLVPTLKPGDIVIIDSLGSPPYSPDLNPIEQLFAKIKHWMRMASERTIEEAWKRIGTITSTVTAQECANYFFCHNKANSKYYSRFAAS